MEEMGQEDESTVGRSWRRPGKRHRARWIGVGGKRKRQGGQMWRMRFTEKKGRHVGTWVGAFLVGTRLLLKMWPCQWVFGEGTEGQSPARRGGREEEATAAEQCKAAEGMQGGRR